MSEYIINQENSDFWSEPCGTNALINLGLSDNPLGNITKFDQWYFDFYPYLLELLRDIDLENANVLEIGIGMGSVTRLLSQKAKKLTCVDIAPGAIDFVRKTLPLDHKVNFICTSILNYKPESNFDIVIAIGSLHHTGDLPRSIAKVESLLEKNGTLLIMVYYAFQPRRIIKHPIKTLKEFGQTRINKKYRKLYFNELDVKIRGKADSNQHGIPAPYTAFSSRKLFLQNNDFRYNISLNNFHNVPILSWFVSRNFFLKYFSKYFGCDIYVVGKYKN
jgi:SAM-dependent methyltransferase